MPFNVKRTHGVAYNDLTWLLDWDFMERRTASGHWAKKLQRNIYLAGTKSTTTNMG